MSFGDRGQPASDGGRAKGARAVGDVESDGCRGRRQVGQVVLHAEAGEVLEVGPVGAQSGGGLGSVDVASRLFDQIFEVAGPRGQRKRWLLHKKNSRWMRGMR